MDKKINIKIIIIAAIVIVALIFSAALFKLEILGAGAILAVALLTLLFLSVLKYPILGPTWILLALPFERLLTVDMGGATVKPIHGVLVAVFIAWLILFVSGKINLKFPLPTVLAVIFWLVCLWSFSVSIDPSRTILVLLYLLIAIIGFWLTIQLVRDIDDIKVLAMVLIITAAILALFGFYQFAGDIVGLPSSVTGIKPGYDKGTFGFPRIHATFLEPLYYANFLFVPFYLAVSYFLAGGIKGKLKWFWALIISLLLLVSIVLTVARGAYIALIVSGLVLIIWQYRQFFKVKNLIVILSVFCLSAVLVLGFLNFSEPRAKDEFLAHIQLEDRTEGESVVSRVQAIDRALDAWYRAPVLGIGLGSYGLWELEDRGEVHLADYYPVVNNQYLETLAETGVIGLIILSIFIIVIFWRSIKAWFATSDTFLRATLSGLTIGVLAIFIQYITFSTIYIIYIWVFIGLLVAVQEIIFRAKAKNRIEN